LWLGGAAIFTFPAINRNRFAVRLSATVLLNLAFLQCAFDFLYDIRGDWFGGHDAAHKGLFLDCAEHLAAI